MKYIKIKKKWVKAQTESITLLGTDSGLHLDIKLLEATL